MKPVKKIRKVEYWSCLKEGHYHKSRSVAARCIERIVDTDFGNSCAEKRKRNDRLIRMWCDGKLNTQIAKELGCSPTIVTSNIYAFIGLLCDHKEDVTPFEDGWTTDRRGKEYVTRVITIDIAKAMMKRLDSWPEGHKKRNRYAWDISRSYAWSWRDGPLLFAGIVRDKNEEEIERDRKKEEENKWIREHPEDYAAQQQAIREREEKEWGIRVSKSQRICVW